MGKRGSFVRFEFLNSKKDGPRLRLEMNPRKLGPQGFLQLKKVLGSPDAPFNLSALVAAARLTRLDVAVDIVGVAVSEIVIAHKDEGKRSYYVGSDGLLETINVHRKLKPKSPKHIQYGEPKKLSHGSKPAGAVLVRAYDRVKERKALLNAPPFGPAPVTRIEIEITRFKKWAALKLLPDMDDRFEKVRAGFHLSQVDHSSAAWNRFRAIRRTDAAAETAATVGLQSIAKQEFEKAIAVLEPDLIAPLVNWKQWQMGVQATGLTLLLEASPLQDLT